MNVSLRTSGRRLLQNFNQNLYQRMATVPRILKTDPVDMKLIDLASADRITVRTLPYLSAKDFKGDLMVFGVGSRKEQSTGNKNACEGSSGQLFDMHKDVMGVDNSQAGGILQAAMLDADFDAKIGSSICAMVAPDRKEGFSKIAAIGTGNLFSGPQTPDQFTAPTSLTPKLGLGLASLLRQQYKVKKVGLAIAYEAKEEIVRDIQAVLEAFFVELHPDNRFKCESSKGQKNAKKSHCEELVLFVKDPASVQSIVDRAKTIARGVYFARLLTNSPANYCNTVSLAMAAADMAKNVGLECEIFDLEEIEKLNMGSYLSVAKGSMYPPKFIHLTYKSSIQSKGIKTVKIAFIGKGLCFDAGGYNIKNAACSIEMMKFDMAGASAIFGAARAIGQLKPPNVEIHFICAAAENMVSDKAYRPGDVIVASNGKTIEVGNTDAEGRLTLADALVYAEKNLAVDCIVDLATLTGACVVALGSDFAGLWSNKNELAKQLLSAAEKSGENLWHMPLVPEYREFLDSKCADMNNVGGKGKGGSITAALFLKEFVESTPWAHIDMAGTCWDDANGTGTGYAVRLLVEFAFNYQNVLKSK